MVLAPLPPNVTAGCSSDDEHFCTVIHAYAHEYLLESSSTGHCPVVPRGWSLLHRILLKYFEYTRSYRDVHRG